MFAERVTSWIRDAKMLICDTHANFPGGRKKEGGGRNKLHLIQLCIHHRYTHDALCVLVIPSTVHHPFSVSALCGSPRFSPLALFRLSRARAPADKNADTARFTLVRTIYGCNFGRVNACSVCVVLFYNENERACGV